MPINNIKQNLKKGFTLIEVLVMTSLTVIIMLSSVVLFMTFLLSQNKIAQKQKLKTEGDNALKQVAQVIREAKQITGCPFKDNQIISLINLENNEININIDDTHLIYTVAGNTIQLTSDDLAANNFLATCREGQEATLVTIEFQLSNDSAVRFTEDPITQTFSTTVSLRNN